MILKLSFNNKICFAYFAFLILSYNNKLTVTNTDMMNKNGIQVFKTPPKLQQ